ncbi:hypothetical protein PENTCL1PPCAC_4971, partial [Pristionchus entomophagus]
NIVFISYGAPCVILCIFTTVATIAIRKNLSSSFVTIYLWTAVVNLLTYFNTWIWIRLLDEKWFYPYYHFAIMCPYYRIVHSFMVHYCYYAQNINGFLLTLDRFFAIA